MRFFCLLSLSLFLLACDDLYSSPPSTVSPYQTTPFQQAEEDKASLKKAPAEERFGVVRCNKSQYSHFNNELLGFLSTTKKPEEIQGPVNCLKDRKDIKGGMLLTGEIFFEGNELFDLENPPSNLELTKSSYLEIHIVNTHNKAIAVLKMPAVPTASTVSGNSAVLTFEDKKGRVSLDGVVNEKDVFTGPFKYENFVNWQGGAGASGTIGYFYIPVCRLFKCQVGDED